MITEATDLLHESHLTLVKPEPVADPILCAKCDFVLVEQMHPDDQAEFIEAFEGEAIFRGKYDEPLCSECAPDDISEDEFRRADIKLDERKDDF